MATTKLGGGRQRRQPILILLLLLLMIMVGGDEAKGGGRIGRTAGLAHLASAPKWVVPVGPIHVELGWRMLCHSVAAAAFPSSAFPTWRT
jgi:hypothetical protein